MHLQKGLQLLTLAKCWTTDSKLLWGCTPAHWAIIMPTLCAQSLSCVWLFVTPRTVACQPPLSMGFSRQEYWSGLPFPSPMPTLRRPFKMGSHPRWIKRNPGVCMCLAPNRVEGLLPKYLQMPGAAFPSKGRKQAIHSKPIPITKNEQNSQNRLKNLHVLPLRTIRELSFLTQVI